MGELRNAFGLPVALPFALSLLGSLGTLLAVILMASSMGSEYNWRTIRTWLISSESRFKMLGAKLISAGIVILLGMIIGVVFGFVMSLITTAIGGYAFDFSFATGDYLWDQFVQFWRVLYVMAPYVLLGFLFAIMGRSAMPGIALGIVVVIMEPIVTGFMTLAGGWIAEVPKYLLAANVNRIQAMSGLPSGFRAGMGVSDTATLPSVPHAFIVLGIYSVVSCVVAFYLFRKRDVTG